MINIIPKIRRNHKKYFVFVGVCKGESGSQRSTPTAKSTESNGSHDFNLFIINLFPQNSLVAEQKNYICIICI